MNVLLFGGDCGTQAMAWKIFNSPRVDDLICSPGNGGTSLFTPSTLLSPNDLPAVSRFVLSEDIDLIVADEPAIAAGVADEAASLHTPVFGSGKAAAALLQSRCAQHEWLLAHNLPAPHGRSFGSADQAEKFAATLTLPVAVRADAPTGPAIICKQRAELRGAIERCLQATHPSEKRSGVLVEEWLPGMLVSASMLADGERSYAIPPVRLHPLTGESGSPIVGAHRGNSPLWARLDERLDVMIRKPLADAWKWAALPVRGWVGANCRLAARGPVIEWLRLTPEPLEATTLLPQWGGDAVPALMAAASGNLTDQDTPAWQTEPGVSVLLIAAGWPASYPTGQPVAGLADLEPGILVFQGNTANPLGFTYTPKAERYASRGGSVWSVLTDRLSGSHSAAASGTTVSGGEILAVVAHAPELATARRRAYANLEHIHVAGTTFLRGVGEHEL